MRSVSVNYDLPKNKVTFTFYNLISSKEIWECKPERALYTMINIADYFKNVMGSEVTFYIN